MNSTKIILAPASDRYEAWLDRKDATQYPAGRGKQVPFALVDAALKNEKHPLAFSIGRAVRGLG